MCDAEIGRFVNDLPTTGWAMNFTSSSQPYTTQHNLQGGPSSPLEKKKLTQECHIKQRDGIDSSSPPFYQLGPQPRVICPYYNYILPDAYPSDSFLTAPSPNPKQYWYFPYYKDPTFWDHPIIRVPKPG
jgi:hypothetical protein